MLLHPIPSQDSVPDSETAAIVPLISVPTDPSKASGKPLQCPLHTCRTRARKKRRNEENSDAPKTDFYICRSQPRFRRPAPQAYHSSTSSRENDKRRTHHARHGKAHFPLAKRD